MTKNKHYAKVAVITRTKNRPQLLNRALQSVQAQTYKDFIHVIVNDGGDRDELNKLLADYGHDKVLVVNNRSTAGHTKALNQGIKSVGSEYVTIIDDDDTWSEDRLELVVDFLDRTGSKGVVNIMDRIVEEVDANGSVRFKSQNRWLDEMKEVSLYKQCLDNYLSNGSFTYRRTVYDELGGYDEYLGVAEDWDFGIRFMLRYDVAVLDTEHALSFYHQRFKQKGNLGNSVFAGVYQHKYYLNVLRNKYLREDIKEGRFGIGYIMNNLHYEREREGVAKEEALRNVVRLEGHMNHVAEQLADKVGRGYLIRKLFGKISRLRGRNRIT